MQSMPMESNWAAEHLQVIRTLMERSAIYRRALAPIMLGTGVLGVAGGVLGFLFKFNSTRGFVGWWLAVAILAVVLSFLLVRRQALKDAEPFWSPPTRRVAQGLLPPLFVGAATGVLGMACPGGELPPGALPIIWMLLYGCALTAAGFFMPRGIKLFGWLFILGGCALLVCSGWRASPAPLEQMHWLMAGAFGGLHLAYGVYLFFTEPRRNAP